MKAVWTWLKRNLWLPISVAATVALAFAYRWMRTKWLEEKLLGKIENLKAEQERIEAESEELHGFFSDKAKKARENVHELTETLGAVQATTDEHRAEQERIRQKEEDRRVALTEAGWDEFDFQDADEEGD
jgi:hypothetical protein|tara:strand:- start:6262 stop:6651 length:390 start_codon:yes stop_codon:yes gene_type:complete